MRSEPGAVPSSVKPGNNIMKTTSLATSVSNRTLGALPLLSEASTPLSADP